MSPSQALESHRSAWSCTAGTQSDESSEKFLPIVFFGFPIVPTKEYLKLENKNPPKMKGFPT